MIFINYRQEDTKAEVTNLHQRLSERYGEDNVFVDFKSIPIGEKWPDAIRQKLESSRVLLAVIGSSWGEVRFTQGKNKGRLRLDDQDDWVRQEICTALRRPGHIRVTVVLIDDANLPETEWGCELDQLSELQQARMRNQGDFERDFVDLCESLESQIPELKHIPGSRLGAGPTPTVQQSDWTLRHYLSTEQRTHASIQLPLISQSGQPVIAPIDELRIDLPLIVSHKHAPTDEDKKLVWSGFEPLFIHDQIRSSHTNALLVDRAARFEDIRRDFEIGSNLRPGSRFVIVGDPGCGKSTLLQWIADFYGSLFSAVPSAGEGSAGPSQPLPPYNWLPILILCRDFAGKALPSQLQDLLQVHLELRQFSDATSSTLISCFERLQDQGRSHSACRRP